SPLVRHDRRRLLTAADLACRPRAMRYSPLPHGTPWGLATFVVVATLQVVRHRNDSVAGEVGACVNATIVTSSTQTSSETQTTDVSARVDTFVSHVVATDAAGAVVVDQTLPVASDDPTVQAAVTAARTALAGGVTSALHTIVGPALTTTVELVE